MTRIARLFAAAGLLLATGITSAHEFWLQPNKFWIPAGQEVGLSLHVGDTLPGETLARNPKKVERFAAAGPDGVEIEVPGAPGANPAGSITPKAAGTYVAIYDSHPSSVTLEAEKFTQYLKEKGLTHIIEQRERSGQASAPGKEQYSRCAKTILTVGEGPTTGFDRAFGMKLEVIPGRHPSSAKVGDEYPSRLLYEGKALPNATVVALHPATSEIQTLTTDADGNFKLRIASPGMWLLSAVHMVAAPAGSGADWESFWASLTFEVTEK